jgi:hypothetical protein
VRTLRLTYSFLNEFRKHTPINVYLSTDLETSRDPFIIPKVKILTIQVCEDPDPHTFKELLSTLSQNLPALSDLHIIGRHSNFPFSPIFETIACSTHLTHSVRRFHLHTHLGIFDSFTAYDGTFKNLEELYIVVDDPPSGSNLLAPLLLSVFSTLQLLDIEVWSHSINLTPLFDTLSSSSRPFHKLTSISLKLYKYNSASLEVPTLHQFLVPHYNALKSLRFDIMKQAAAAWLAAVVNEEVALSSLERLLLLPTEESLSHLKTLLLRISSTLSELVIKNCISYGAATDLIESAMPCNLRVLEMETPDLDITLLDLLASRLPHLEELTLTIARVVCPEGSVPEEDSVPWEYDEYDIYLGENYVG